MNLHQTTVALSLLHALAACAGAPPANTATRMPEVAQHGSHPGASGPAATDSDSADTEHGKLSELSRVAGDIVLCEHKVPEQTCTRHHPELVAQFKRAGDWCKPHGLPESQCFECHPDLTFEPLPQLQAGADVAWLSQAGEDVPELEPHAVKGKVTIFEFYADWCAACRKVDGHVYQRIAQGDARIAYRKLNLVQWDSPLALRYVQDVPSLPYLVVFDTHGQKFKALHGADLAALDAAITAAGNR